MRFVSWHEQRVSGDRKRLPYFLNICLKASWRIVLFQLKKISDESFIIKLVTAECTCTVSVNYGYRSALCCMLECIVFFFQQPHLLGFIQKPFYPLSNYHLAFLSFFLIVWWSFQDGDSSFAPWLWRQPLLLQFLCVHRTQQSKQQLHWLPFGGKWRRMGCRGIFSKQIYGGCGYYISGILCLDIQFKDILYSLVAYL